MSFIKYAAALAISLGSAGAVLAADVALVISNTTYDRRAAIRNVDRDFRDLVRAYDRDGYTVLTGRNRSASQMAELLAEFESEAKDADRIIVHFTGHVEPSGQNLRLVTRDMGEGSLVGAHYAAPSLDLIYELLAHRPGRAALLIATPDAQIGVQIAAGPRIPQGVLVMAGQPRQFNRFVTRSFLGSNVAAASVDAGNIVVTGYVSDQPMTRAEDRAVAPPTPTVADDTAVELRVWRAAAQKGDRDALEQYLRQYPRGLFAREAQARIAALGPEISPEEQIEKALNLTRAQRRSIQSNLTVLGFNTRGVDGIFGNGTRRAVEAWQRSIGFRSSGFLDRAQIRVLEDAATRRREEIKAEEDAAKAERDQQDLAFWRTTGSSGREEDLRNYLAKYPDGLFAPQAKALLAEIDGADTFREDEAALAIENRLNMNQKTRLLAEQQLAKLGLNPGKVDGRFDAATRRAIATFQGQKGLPATGYLTSDTVGQLIVATLLR